MGETLPNKLVFDPRIAPVRQDSRGLHPHDRYMRLLCFVLAGYALAGKGFAYIGYPPLLIGEVTMMLGVLVIYTSGCGFAMLANLPSLLLLSLLSLVLFRTALDFPAYKVDAIRDSVTVLYGLFAFAVIALLLEKPERLSWMLQRYGGFAWLYGIVGIVSVYVTTEAQRIMPVWPLSGISIVYVRLGEAAIHLSGAAVFMILGLRQVSPWWIVAMGLSIVLISPSRGATMACILPIIAAIVLSGKTMRVLPTALAAITIFIAAYIVGVDIPTPQGRSIGPEQIVNNIESVLGGQTDPGMDGTKEWRLRWWKAIVEYTFNGPYFWTGKGYGMGLAEADGFVVGLEHGGPIVRSPHNVHLTILARSGVPGLALWFLMLAAWYAMLTRDVLTARSRGDTPWANMFIWIGCYLAAVVIDATFDVAIEGPMVGIWFWSIFGFGIGASMIYRFMVAEAMDRTP